MKRVCTPRLSTFSYTGLYRYSLTFCTDHRRRVFTSVTVVDEVLSHFLRAAATEGFAILAYCFMPDHVHLLIEAERETSDGRAFIHRAKQAAGYWYAQSSGAKLWQRSAWDHVLRDEEPSWKTIRYILGNPVRAGIVERPEDYPFSGSTRYEWDDLMAELETDSGRP